MLILKRQLVIFRHPDASGGSGGGPPAGPDLGSWATRPGAGEAVLERLRRLAGAILEAGERMNLTADREPTLFWQRHIADSLGAADAIENVLGQPVAGRILDVGSGAGIPGLVWALLWPQARVELMETRQKRAEFLRETATALGLDNVGVLSGRAEELGHAPELRESFDLVTARALAPLPTLAELTLPFLRLGGWLGAIKSLPLEDELVQCRPALELLGGEPDVLMRPYARGDGKACVVCLVRKGRPTPPAYPRRANLPERRPLGR